MMANPQLENGYSKLANELLEALMKIRIPGESMQILLTIIRKTYGFNKKKDIIALSQFVESTGIRKSHIQRAVTKLLEMNIVTQKGKGKSVSYSLNKDYETWKQLPKKGTTKNHKIVPIIGNGVPQKGNESSLKGEQKFPIKGYTKEKRNIKETLTKDRDPIFKNTRISDINNIDNTDPKYRDFFKNNRNITLYTDPEIIQHGNIKSAGDIIKRLNIPNPNLVNKKELTELWIKKVDRVQIAIWNDTKISRTQILKLAIKTGDMECPQFLTLIVIIQASKQADRPYNYIKAIISNPESLEYYRDQALKTANPLTGMLKQLIDKNNVNQDTTSG